MWRGPCVCFLLLCVFGFLFSLTEVFFGPSSRFVVFVFQASDLFLDVQLPQQFLMGFLLRGMLDRWQPFGVFLTKFQRWKSRPALCFSRNMWPLIGWNFSRNFGPKKQVFGSRLQGWLESQRDFFLFHSMLFFGLLQNDLPKMGEKIWIFVFFFIFGEEGNKQMILCFKNLGWHEPLNPGWLMKGSLFYGLWNKPYMCWGPNSRCFHRIGDGHQPNK